MLVKVAHPVYSLSPGLEEDTILAGGGGGKGNTGIPNSIIKLKIVDNKLAIDSSVMYEDSISSIATYKGDKKQYIAINEGSKLLLLNSKFNELKSYETEAKKPIFRNLCFSKQGNLLLCLDSDDALHLLKVPSLQLVKKTKADTYRRATFFYSGSDTFIAAATDECVKLLRPNDKLKEIATTEKFDFLPKQLLADDGRILYLGNNNKKKLSYLAEIRFDHDKLITAKLINPTKGLITAATMTDKTIGVGTSDGNVYILNGNTYKTMRINQNKHEWAISSAVQLGNYVATAGLDSLVILTPNSKNPISILLILAVIVLIAAIGIGMYMKM